MMSGVRESPSGGRPGALNICRMPRAPEDLADAGDVGRRPATAVSSVATAAATEQPLFSHSSDTSSSVGPIWSPALDSESGRQASIRREGEVVTGPVLVMRV